VQNCLIYQALEKFTWVHRKKCFGTRKNQLAAQKKQCFGTRKNQLGAPNVFVLALEKSVGCHKKNPYKHGFGNLRTNSG
jgi:hypothetical protein